MRLWTFARTSLLGQALIGVAVLVLPLLALIFAIINSLATTSEDAQRRFLLYTAASIARAVDTELQRYLTIGEMLAASEQLARDDIAGFLRQARAMLEMTDVTVVLHDAMQQVGNSAYPDITPLPPRSEAGYAAQLIALQRGQPYISNVYFGALKQQWLATVEIPPARVAGHRYALAVVFPLAPFRDLLSTAAVSDNWVVGIADGNGRFVAGFPGERRSAGNPVSPAWAATLRQDGLSDIVTVDGFAVVNANAATKLADWTVGIGLTKVSLATSVERSYHWALLTAIVMAAAMAGLTAFLAYRLSTGLHVLQDGLLARIAGRPGPTPKIPREFLSLWRGAGAAADERERTARALETTAQEARDAHAKLQRSTQILQAISDLTSEMIYAKDQEGRLVFASRAMANLHQRTPDDLLGATVLTYVRDPDEAAVITNNDRMVLSGTSFIGEEVVTAADGRRRVFLTHKTPWKAAGTVNGILGLSVDITERRRQEEHLRFVMAEVSHRAKNLLAVVQAVARSSSRTTSTPKEFVDRFNARLHALGQALDVLVSNQWHGADLKDLVLSQLGHFETDIGTRITLEGPPLTVTPTAAQSLGMAMHELATNAGKYGALSRETGQLRISWQITDDTFVMHWVEQGGPPVMPPERTGFGTSVFDTVLRASFDCEPCLTFDPAGFRWSLRCHRSHIEAKTEASAVSAL